jgi:hypothetical protein
MAPGFRASVSLRSRSKTAWGTRSRGAVLLGGTLLVAAAILYLSVQVSFAKYAFTGLWWIHTEGTVTNSATTSVPTIRFTARDGSAVLFKEDYILLCGGGRSFCWIRDFTPGQVVPVVYDPAEPTRAYVHDWALFANVLGWFAVAGIGLILALIMFLPSIKTPVEFSIRMGSGSHPQ